MSTNPIHLDHCYYKDYPTPTTSEYSNTNNTLSTEICQITSK